jgi:hypothetical protein
VITDLKIGSFYWVKIVYDPDTDHEWENEEMPARYAGKNAAGKDLWNYIGQEGETDWPVRWIGPEIINTEG